MVTFLFWLWCLYLDRSVKCGLKSKGVHSLSGEEWLIEMLAFSELFDGLATPKPGYRKTKSELIGFCKGLIYFLS
jgi:hypothetical protein